MSNLVKEVIAELCEIESEEFLCERSIRLAELVRTTLNKFMEPKFFENDSVGDAGTIELEIELSQLYAASWSSKDEIDEEFNKKIDLTIKVLTHVYLS